MSNHDELIAQFTEITGGTADVARFYLESSNWALQDALTTYLAPQNEADEGHDDMSQDGDDLDVLLANSNKSDTLQQTDEKKTEGFKKSGTSKAKPKFATLHNLSQRSSSDEEGQAFYAGGSERSGQQVLGPPKRKNFREKLTDMFRQAHEQTHDHPSPSTSSSSGANWGVGLRLGQTENDHSVVGSGAKAHAQSQRAESVILKLWSQGFSINDGELRLYDDPDNKEFLETVMRGEIPSELMEMGSMVSVDVEDHRQEDFKRKVKKVQTFKGPGHTLGSPAPTIVENIREDKPSTNVEETDKIAVERLNMNPSEGVTQLQIRLADGSRITSQFNLTHTVGDIRQFIQNARPQYANRTFALVSSFPTRELDDDTVTIEKASLKNAAIMQRLK